MYAKFFPSDLNLNSYPLYLTNTYTCGVTIMSMVRNGNFRIYYNWLFKHFLNGKECSN